MSPICNLIVAALFMGIIVLVVTSYNAVHRCITIFYEIGTPFVFPPHSYIRLYDKIFTKQVTVILLTVLAYW